METGILETSAPVAPAAGNRLLWGGAGVTLLLHLLVITHYGIFRDELYYLACADHLAWGYVDHPPLSIAILWLTRAVLGDSLWAIRLPPALAFAATVALTGWLTREAGGKRGAQILAMLIVLLTPVYLGVGHYFSMNAFDTLLWTLALCLLMRLLVAPRPELWLWLGITLGLGLLNKISVLWLLAGITVGLLCTPYRRVFATPGPWIAAVVAGVLFLPHVVWQVHNGWPTREFIHNATTLKMAAVPPAQFLLAQLLQMNPLFAPLWLTGLLWSLTSRASGRWRVGGIVFLTVMVILLVNGKSRSMYLAPAYPVLFATGAVAWERWWKARKWDWMPPLAFGLLLAGGIASLPFALPVLPVTRYIRYSAAIGIKPPQEEKGMAPLLPQFYADMHGWEEMAEAVARVYHELPPSQQAECAIYASNYGEAGAIDYFGKKYGLPRAICAHNNYWLWGTQGWNGSTLIVLNTMSAQSQEQFDSVRQVAAVPNPLGMPYEQDMPIYVAHHLKAPIVAVWQSAKHYQ
jgi:Dolichyl-phosphate-mannose-protein mannosyltransferase